MVAGQSDAICTQLAHSHNPMNEVWPSNPLDAHDAHVHTKFHLGEDPELPLSILFIASDTIETAQSNSRRLVPNGRLVRWCKGTVHIIVPRFVPSLLRQLNHPSPSELRLRVSDLLTSGHGPLSHA